MGNCAGVDWASEKHDVLIADASGKELLAGIQGYAAQHDLEIEGLPKDPKAEVPPEQVVGVLRAFVGSFFPQLTGKAPSA